MTVPRLAKVGAARHAALDYAITSAVAVAFPLLVGTLTGHVGEGALVALGAFLVTNAAYQGPYGLRARALIAAVAVIAVGVTIGGLVSGNRWLAVVALPIFVAIGSVIPQVGIIFAIATVLAAVRPLVAPFPADVLLETAGALWVVMLFLAPWPYRRMRPFLMAAAEAIGALADQLEAVTESDDVWEERRRSATDALNELWAACGLYPVGCEAGEGSGLKPLAEALARVMHEIVALRALVVAVRRRSPEASEAEAEPAPEVEQAPEAERAPAAELAPEVESAITALAARLRRLAVLVQVAGPAPLSRQAAQPEPHLDPLRRLAELVEELRRDALLGHGDLVSAALLDQLRRTTERIAAAIDAAAEIVTGGLSVGLNLPRPPERGGLRSLWQTVLTDVRTRSLRFRRFTRTAIATAVAMVIWAELPLRHAYWLPIAVVLCMRHTYGETASRVTQRVGGTAAGAALGAILLALAPGRPALLAAIFCAALTAYALRSVSYTVWTALNTPLVMMLVDYSTPVDWRVAGERIGLTVAGGVLALVTARLFWPSSRGDDTVLLERLAAMSEEHAPLMRAVAERVAGADVPLDERFAVAGDLVEQLDEAVGRLAQEPAPDRERIARLYDAVAAAHRICDHLITLRRLVGADSVDPGPVPAILDHLADRLEEMAGELRAGRAPEVPAPDIDQQLAVLDDFLSCVIRRRRAEVTAGIGLGEITPLRRTLRQAVAVRDVLHALRDDIEALGHALRAVSPLPARTPVSRPPSPW